MAVSAARLAADSLRLLPRKRLSRALGQVADLRGSPALVARAVDAFVRYYSVDMSDVDVPQGGFQSFNHFFTRRLRPGARPIDPDPTALVSPADGRMTECGRVQAGSLMLVKGQPYKLAELLGDEEAARRFDGGTYFVVYLSPRDYHRVHAPVGGAVRSVRHLGGTLFPVNDIGMRYVPQLFVRNERVVTHLSTESHGEVVVVMVGAIGVGRISICFDDVTTNVGRAPTLRHYGSDGPTLERGSELGVFNLGSTVLVFVEPRQQLTFDRELGEAVRVGETIVRRTVG